MSSGRVNLILALLGVALMVFVFNCSPAKDQRGPTEQSMVMAGVAPIAGLVEAITGEVLAVEVLVQPGQNPHVFEPSPGQIMSLGKARMLFTVGLPFEHQLIGKVSGAMPDLRIIDLSEGLELQPFEDEGHRHAGHDHDGEHQHGSPEHSSLDPHVWMSPRLVLTMAEKIAGELSRAYPEHSQVFLARLERYRADIATIDAAIAGQLAPYIGRTFYVFHPSFGYFAHHYKLKQRAIEIEGKSPSPRNLAELIEQVKQDGAAVIFIQPQFDDKGAMAIARGIDGMTVTLDPLAREVGKNFLTMSEHLVASFSGTREAEGLE